MPATVHQKELWTINPFLLPFMARAICKPFFLWAVCLLNFPLYSIEPSPFCCAQGKLCFSSLANLQFPCRSNSLFGYAALFSCIDLSLCHHILTYPKRLTCALLMALSFYHFLPTFPSFQCSWFIEFFSLCAPHLIVNAARRVSARVRLISVFCMDLIHQSLGTNLSAFFFSVSQVQFPCILSRVCCSCNFLSMITNKVGSVLRIIS